jgi:ABC-type polar amino acid transport system ATPase subunit
MIRLENVHKWFGSLEVLRGIDLEVTRGEVVVVIGPSGSGKSTLLRVINYLEPFQEGTIYLNERRRSARFAPASAWFRSGSTSSRT